MEEIVLRKKQEIVYRQIQQAFKAGHKKIMVRASAGFGKTVLAAYIIKQAISKGKRIAFVCDMQTLVQQSTAEFRRFGIDCGIIMADSPEYRPWAQAQVCSVQTLMRRKDLDIDVYLIDEAHVTYKHMIELMDRVNLVPFIALSATPLTRGAGKIYSHMVCGPQPQELVEDNDLLPPVCYGPETINTAGLKTTAGDFNQKQLYERVSKPGITADIINTYLQLGEGRQAICFPVNVLHSKDLTNGFNNAGVPCIHIDANTSADDRNDAYEKLANFEIQMICSVGVLSKGFNVPCVSCSILAYATKSKMKMIQTASRANRKYKDQTEYIVLDHGNNIFTLGYPDQDLPDYLDDGERTEAQKQKDEKSESEEKELLPKKCPQCNQLVEAKIFTCPGCGYIFSQKSDVEVNAGELKELKRKKSTPAEKRNKTISKEDKQAFYSAALEHCRKKGYKEGWASNKYKSYFSVWPNAMGKVAGGHSELFSSYLTSSNIRYARSQDKLS